MDPITIVATTLTVVGPLLGALSKFFGTRAEGDLPGKGAYKGPAVPPAKATGGHVLMAFAALVLVFGLLTVVRYWKQILQNEALIFYAFWLFLTMVFGMFVQVLATNYRLGKPLGRVDSAQLIFPILFSIVVFYPIWSTVSSSPKGLFSFYAAFLNGYFWESVVTAARLPNSREES